MQRANFNALPPPTEGGDKEKLECFVDFCEDAIFEMQHAESLMKADDSGGFKKESSGPSLPSEDAPRLVSCSCQSAWPDLAKF